MSKKKILWLVGPQDKHVSGVGKYSSTLIENINHEDFEIVVKEIPFAARTFSRYVYQYLYLPVYLVLISGRYANTILYEESFAYLSIFTKLTKTRTLLIFHHVGNYFSSQTLIERLKEMLLGFNLKASSLCDVVVFPTNKVKDDYRKIIKSKSTLEVIPNAFDFSKLTIAHKKEVHVECKKIIMLYIGTEETRKNLNCAVEGLAMSKNKHSYHFVKVGKALIKENRKKLLAILEEANISYDIYDQVDDATLCNLLNESDVFLSPSLLEGFGRTPVEAQYFSSLVVASNIPVFKEVLGGGGNICREA